MVAKREEDKRKKSTKDSKKRAQADQLHFPGSRIGVDSEMSAYWMVMEVRPHLHTIICMDPFVVCYMLGGLQWRHGMFG